MENLNGTRHRKRRAMTSSAARDVRRHGHDDALEFALEIGLAGDYKNNPQAKKDVVDLAGDTHSVKSGNKKWQIFLYSHNRFETDEFFKLMNGIGDLFKECLNVFPLDFVEYQKNKLLAKEKLRLPMVKLAEKLRDPLRLKAFLNKSMFNGGEVDYLTVKDNGLFHVFLNVDVSKVLVENLEVCNSRAISAGQTPELKVLFRYEGVNLGEIEIRTDSAVHYREVKFSVTKPKIMKLLFDKIPLTKKYSKKVLVYGNAAKKFGRW